MAFIPPDVHLGDAWTYYNEHQEMDLLLLAAYGAPVLASDLVPQEMY